MTDSLSLLIAFGVTSLAIEMTPGPNMGYLAVLGISQGRLAGLSAVLGVALGLCVLGLLVGFGAGSFVLDNRWAYEALRWAGSLYLMWLAYDGWRDCRQGAGCPGCRSILPASFPTRSDYKSAQSKGCDIFRCRSAEIRRSDPKTREPTASACRDLCRYSNRCSCRSGFASKSAPANVHEARPTARQFGCLRAVAWGRCHMAVVLAWQAVITRQQ